MIDFLFNTHWLIAVALWFLIGTLWADFIIYFKNRVANHIEFDNAAKIMNIIIWPISVIIFMVGVVMGLINFFSKK